MANMPERGLLLTACPSEGSTPKEASYQEDVIDAVPSGYSTRPEEVVLPDLDPDANSRGATVSGIVYVGQLDDPNGNYPIFC